MVWLLLIGGTMLVADRVIKVAVLHGWQDGFGPLRVLLVRNDALVFSWPAPNWLAAIIMVVAMVIVAAVAFRWWHHGQRGPVLGLLFVLLGAASNLYDRLVYGYVIDWAYVGPWWPVMNLADVVVAFGVVVAWRRWRRH